MRDNTMHLLKNSWQFSFKITGKATRISFEKDQFTCETHYVCQGYTLLVYSAFLGPVLKIILGIVLSNSFKLRATICSIQTRFASLFGNFRLILHKV